jgi:hypothetical protein
MTKDEDENHHNDQSQQQPHEHPAPQGTVRLARGRKLVLRIDRRSGRFVFHPLTTPVGLRFNLQHEDD